MHVGTCDSRGEGRLGAVGLWVLRGAPLLRVVSVGRTCWDVPRAVRKMTHFHEV